MSTPRFLRVTEYRAVAYRRTWRAGVLTAFANPLFFLLAMGFGVGSLVDGNDPASLEGVSYVAFLAPGLLAATAMNVAVSEATYPVLASVLWVPVARGQVATPLRPADVSVGQLTWAALRVLVSAVAFVAVMLVVGAVESAWVVLAVPAAVATGLAFAAPIAAWSITQQGDNGFPPLQRFVIMPMFLFSGTFFPVDQLPSVLQPIAVLTPLWHGVRLCRTLSLGDATLWGSLAHLAYLSALAVAGALIAARNYDRRLRP
jgi:lipooligosaccharide transport system permease protein